jgi:hypothetical protein
MAFISNKGFEGKKLNKKIYKNVLDKFKRCVLFVCFFQTMTDIVGNPEEERRGEFYEQSWTQEAVCRYFYSKVQQKRAELEQALGIRNN